MKLLNRFPGESIQFPSLQVCRKKLDKHQPAITQFFLPKGRAMDWMVILFSFGERTSVRPETNRTDISCVVLINDLIAEKVLNKQEDYLNDC